jgi:NitT/TauT family transport system substrate-binding protein
MRRGYRLAALLQLTLVLAGCGDAATRREVVKVGYTNVTGVSGLFVAQEQGYFHKHGIEIEPVMIALNSTIPSALAGGSINIGNASPPTFFQAVEGGLDLVVIGGGSINDAVESGQGLIARNGSGIRSARDLEGKRVGVPGMGAYMHVMFRQWLTMKGADERKVNFVEVPFAQGADILRAGNVDAVLSTDPYFSRILQTGGGTLVTRYLMEMPKGVSALYYASNGKWARAHPATVAKFRAAIRDAHAYVAREPAKTRDAIVRNIKLPPEVAAAVKIPRLRLDVPESDVRFWVDVLARQGITRTRPAAAPLIFQPNDEGTAGGKGS